jgi:hypothetical protein
MSEDRPVYYAGPAIEALLVDRQALIRLTRMALDELNNRRLLTPQLTGEQDIGHAIRYWDTVLDWIQQQRGAEVVFLDRLG